MTRKDLEQLKWLKKEVEQARREYLNAKPVYEADSVVGSTPDRWDKHIIPIYGYTYRDIDRKLKRYEKLIKKLDDEIDRLEEWISSVPDSLMRQILQLRYRNGLRWGQIGGELGYDRTTVAKKHEAFFEDK